MISPGHDPCGHTQGIPLAFQLLLAASWRCARARGRMLLAARFDRHPRIALHFTAPPLRRLNLTGKGVANPTGQENQELSEIWTGAPTGGAIHLEGWGSTSRRV